MSFYRPAKLGSSPPKCSPRQPAGNSFEARMTVNYNLDVSSSDSIGFIRLLFRWRGSVWRSVYKELIFWIVCYYIVFVIYRCGLEGDAQKNFGRLATMFESQLNYIPLTFMLGFFVNVIIDRWKQIINNMGWIENNALLISSTFRGTDEASVMTRRTLVRYLILAQILVFRNICMKVRRRFPTIESIVRAGFMTAEEKAEIQSIQIPYNKYWVPVQWAYVTAQRKFEKDKIQPTFFNNFMNEMNRYRTDLSRIVNYDWVPIPLAYPQVVFMAVRVYFLICLISRQYVLQPVNSGEKTLDIYVPVMTIIQFIFLIGWMKVAEALLNPLGEDDDDFECNFLIDKNIATGMAIVDGAFDRLPPLKKDKFMGYNFMQRNKWTDGEDMIKGSAAAVELSESEDQSQSTITTTSTTMDQLDQIAVIVDCLSPDHEDEGRSRSHSKIDALRSRLNSVFSQTHEHKEFDANGAYSQRYFSQMSRY